MITTEPVIIISLECIQSIQYPVSLAMTGLVARVLLVMTTLAEGGRGEEEPPCMISCCLACSPGYNCQVCYQLNKSDPLNCPCVATFNPSDLSLLADFSRVSSAGSIRLEEARTEGRFCFKCDKVFDGKPNKPNQPNQANQVEETQAQMHSGTKNRQFYSFDTFNIQPVTLG